MQLLQTGEERQPSGRVISSLGSGERGRPPTCVKTLADGDGVAVVAVAEGAGEEFVEDFGLEGDLRPPLLGECLWPLPAREAVLVVGSPFVRPTRAQCQCPHPRRSRHSPCSPVPAFR